MLRLSNAAIAPGKVIEATSTSGIDTCPFDLRKSESNFEGDLPEPFIPTIIIIIALFKVASLEPIFISETKILPSGADGNNASNQLQSIASNFGISTGNASGGSITSANLFPEVIRSRRLARTILKRHFNTARYGKNKPLVSILTGVLDVQKDYDILMKTGISDLEDRITVFPIPDTPLLIIRVSAFEPQLAADIATAIVEELNFLQILFKSSRIKEKKMFIQDRIKDVEKELIKAEEALKYYRETNRNIQKSPSLLLKQERLRREVGTQVQLYQTLKSQFEIAQIELVEKSNMVDILDPPEAPLQKVGPKRSMIMIVVTIFSVFSVSRVLPC